jgi:hypothetical protein
MADSTVRGATAASRPRWPYLGRPQVLLLVAGLVTAVASLLPWLETVFGGTNGVLLGGMITFYAALLAVPGAIWRRRGVVLAHALILAVPAIAIPTWRLAWALRRLPALGEAWLPGPGLVLVLISGCVAAYAAMSLWWQSDARHG